MKPTKNNLILAELRDGQPAEFFAFTVRLWKKHPQEFGMRTYAATYPCTKRVSAALATLHANGLVRMVGTLHYQITDAGRAALEVARLPYSPNKARQIEVLEARLAELRAEVGV